jgi:lysozyme
MREREGKMKPYIFSVIVLVIGLCTLHYYGYIWYNSVFTIGYEVRGLDVSHHQGKIDWEKVKEEGKFRFVYMKATEGKDFKDKRFAYNWEKAKENGFLTGAYHFFSMKSSGIEQASHFKKVVPVQSNSLPPVVDVEIATYHDKKKVRDNLLSMMKELEATYQKKPILYVTYDTYHAYIENSFEGYRIWIRDIFKFPSLPKKDWEIWQYHNRGHVDGISTYVDINVYQHTLFDLQNLK